MYTAQCEWYRDITQPRGPAGHREQGSQAIAHDDRLPRMSDTKTNDGGQHE